jgi:2-polyprenyl-3-methyl-5-hydroxy-6-metoxy-1,4-benzoquinol methylase
MNLAGPSLEEQAKYWSDWSIQSARGEGQGDPYDDRVCAMVRACAARCADRGQAADVGCGTGWITRVLGTEFREALGFDLPSPAIEKAAADLPHVKFVRGDFLAATANVPAGTCDMVVSCEVVAHVANQREFFVRCRSMLRPGGRFLLFTQNPVVWMNESHLTPKSPSHLRHWPSRDEVRAHCQAARLRIESASTLEPAGDKGLLWWRPYAMGALRRVIGRPRAKQVFERMGLGRVLAFEAIAE